MRSLNYQPRSTALDRRRLQHPRVPTQLLPETMVRRRVTRTMVAHRDELPNLNHVCVAQPKSAAFIVTRPQINATYSKVCVDTRNLGNVTAFKFHAFHNQADFPGRRMRRGCQCPPGACRAPSNVFVLLGRSVGD